MLRISTFDSRNFILFRISFAFSYISISLNDSYRIFQLDLEASLSFDSAVSPTLEHPSSFIYDNCKQIRAIFCTSANFFFSFWSDVFAALEIAGLICAGDLFFFVWSYVIHLYRRDCKWMGARHKILIDHNTSSWPLGTVVKPKARHYPPNKIQF